MSAAQPEIAPEESQTESSVQSVRGWLRTAREVATADTTLILGVITLLGLALRLYRLDGLPAEMWGDVITHYQLAQKVMSGHPYTDYEFGGDGPLFSYVVSAVAAVGGLSFYTMKLTTVLIGTGVIVAVYFLAKELFESREIGLIAALVTAISFWDITFSRQAKPHILVALIACMAVTFAAQRRVVPAGIMLGLGMYVQASFWGMPVAFLASPLALVLGMIVALPEIVNFARDPSALVGSSSFIGEKLHANRLTAPEMVLQVLNNIWKNALTFNIRGDVVFRANIPLHPHLDQLSGLLFLAGMALILTRIARQHDWKLLFWFIIPFLVVQIPSVLDMHSENVPNMGRMIGAMPFAYIAVAYAIYWAAAGLCRLMRGRRGATLLATGTVAVTLVVIFCINAYNYFVVYPRTLPNNNTPFDLAIAQQVNQVGSGADSILVGCCWGDWGQPEPDAVVYRSDPSAHLFLASSTQDASSIIAQQVPLGSDVVLYLDPSQSVDASRFSQALDVSRQQMLKADGWDVAWVVEGRKQ